MPSSSRGDDGAKKDVSSFNFFFSHSCLCVNLRMKITRGFCGFRCVSQSCISTSLAYTQRLSFWWSRVLWWCFRLIPAKWWIVGDLILCISFTLREISAEFSDILFSLCLNIFAVHKNSRRVINFFLGISTFFNLLVIENETEKFL